MRELNIRRRGAKKKSNCWCLSLYSLIELAFFSTELSIKFATTKRAITISHRLRSHYAQNKTDHSFAFFNSVQWKCVITLTQSPAIPTFILRSLHWLKKMLPPFTNLTFKSSRPAAFASPSTPAFWYFIFFLYFVILNRLSPFLKI